MSFLDKVKAGVKSGAEQAATRAQSELDRLQAKRTLQQAYGELGEKTFGLVGRGELDHAELQPAIDRIRAATAELDSIGQEAEHPQPAPPAEESEPEPTAAESPPHS